ncbi:protein of unknown function DUF882 [Methylocella silvestris BL2]|uniref:Murein endopeptidase K n=1 Tax=Methylocella silvestris (strain DSM 15510 / CIP 108128 / LMG 27833 / NCIMB 13906 / BL2) TaxID=395965 RepID=B8ERP2_METSB|nr:DUF882 domain-containing protein [Methylocella silvestris]ACK51094.1 protein of unknown function DUF882 [Methylocella silvestris BL2]
MRRARSRFVPARQALRLAAVSAAALLCSLFAGSSTETAEANGDTRTLNLYHSHTGESIQATFRVNGSYDPAVLEKLNYFLRDWRNNDRTRMDPRLFDTVWEVYRTAGATQPIVIFSAYRSPETNAMLRRRSSAVAEYSQHMLGKAMDTTMPGMSMEQIREIGIKMQRGGVGFYSRENFVHLDVGGVRSWPRLSYEQLARLFPDGKSAHLASNGRSLPRYEEARAEIASRGGVVSDAPQAMAGGGFFGWLFGGGRDRQEEAEAVRGAMPGRGPAPSGATQVAALEKPAPAVRMTRAERRAAEKAAKAAPALAAIDAADPPDANANRSLVAALAPPPAPIPAAQPRLAAAVPAPTAPTPPPRAAEQAAAPDAPVKDAAKDRDNEKDAAKEKPDAVSKQLMAAVPLPPARPDDLIAYADVPLPPSRAEHLIQTASLTAAPMTTPQVVADAVTKPVPTTVAAKMDAARAEAAKSDPAKAGMAMTLARAASLPVVITRGPKDQQVMPASVLGYAASSGAGPRQRIARLGKDGDAPDIVSARLDRSNFSDLTSETPTAEAPPASLLGQALTGLRQAARIVPDALAAAPSASYKLAFGAASGILNYASFTKPQPPKEASHADKVSIVDASAK